MYIVLETLKPQFPTFSEYVRLHSISSFSSQFFLEQTLLNQFQLERLFSLISLCKVKLVLKMKGRTEILR